MINPIKNLENADKDIYKIAIYIHWPFCKKKCPYCDFNSHVRNDIDTNKWLNAYIKAIYGYKDILSKRVIQSIFFGGGTPSLANPIIIEKIINTLREISTFAKDIEITIEANPTSIDINNVKYLSQVGVNRVSIGIQSVRDRHLKFLGREHTANESIAAIDIIANYFDNYSFDLIYALPEQEVKEWVDDLEFIMKFTKNHVSLYQLTIEEGTTFYKDFYNGKFIMPNEDKSVEFYLKTQEIMEKYGLPAYEISNHARVDFVMRDRIEDGMKYKCKHNMTYWLYNDYIGIGPGAHGRYTIINNSNANTNVNASTNTNVNMYNQKFATYEYKLPEKWLEKIEENGNNIEEIVELTKEQIIQEKLLMNLRLRSGIVIDDLIYMGVDMNKVEELILGGFMYKYYYNNELYGDNKHQKQYVTTTTRGSLLLNAIIAQLDPSNSSF